MDITRYGDSLSPMETDGRDIDRNIGSLQGEGAVQRVSGVSDEHAAHMASRRWAQPEDAADVTYYDRPLLQEPVWKWFIPAYYYVGGVTGAALVLSAAAQMQFFEGRDRLIRRCRWLAFAGSAISAVLLVADLGRPARFLNMLRVFRPTSAMNMGAWILSGTGAFSTPALLFAGSRFGNVAGAFAGLFGAGLATYTGVLAANTAIPVWQASRRFLPVLFGTSAMSSLGSLLLMFPGSPEERSLVATFGAIGQAGELVAAAAMRREASQVERVGRPFEKGVSGAMWKTAAVLTAASAVLTVLPGRGRAKQITAGLLGTFGSMLMRFSIEQLGKASARDARASFHQQRRG